MTLVRVSLCLAMLAVQSTTSMLISTMHAPALPAFHVRRSTIAMQSKDAPWKGLNEMNKMKAMKVSPPKVRGQKLPADMVEVTQSFKKEYARKDLEQLWGAVMAIYGTQTLAKQAVLENPQILNPSYSFCNTMLASRDVLYDMMGKDEALEVMLKNPAVLQCGPSLDTLGPDEIKGFANLRNFFNNLIPKESQSAAIGLLLAFCLFPILAVNNPDLADTGVTNLVKPIVGILFAVAIEGSRILIVGTIVKGKISGDERLKKAEEAEARRMGKTKPNGGKTNDTKQWVGF